MTTLAAPAQISQLDMPGMPPRLELQTHATAHSLVPGHEVRYLGHVSGGPRYGARGGVKHVLARKAVVDMRHSGTWHIPYLFLSKGLGGCGRMGCADERQPSACPFG